VSENFAHALSHTHAHTHNTFQLNDTFPVTTPVSQHSTVWRNTTSTPLSVHVRTWAGLGAESSRLLFL